MVLQQIIKWSQTLSPWQQDAIARLYAKGELTPSDFDDLYALLKAEYGIPDPKGRTPNKLAPDCTKAKETSSSHVELVAIKNLQNVNALALNQVLPIQLKGMTVIYGHNGSGKSGYSRVLKKACRARDQSEPILPDAKLAPGITGKAEAIFEILIDGAPQEVKWTNGTPTPEPLTQIGIFDAHCARAYLDEEDDFSYVPYGLDILEGLAKACNRLKSMLEEEYSRSAVNTATFANLPTSTTAGRLAAGLSYRTKVEAVEDLATLSSEDLAKHAELEKSLKEDNPKEKAAQIQLRAGRLTKLAERCAEMIPKVADEQAKSVRFAVDTYKAAKQVAEAASKLFKETEGLLPGTGSEVWQTLFEAARHFAVQAHPEKHFPHLSPDDACPLCQQPLGDGAERLIAFDSFIQQEAEKTARAKRAEAAAKYNQIDKADLNILFDPELESELKTLDPDLAALCATIQPALDFRRNAIKAACTGEENWEAIGAEPVNPCERLRALAKRLYEETVVLQKAADDKVRAELVQQHAELSARIQFSKVKPAVLEAISKFSHLEKLRKCLAAVRTNAITTKSTELTQEVVAKGLADVLNAEFKMLGVNELHVNLHAQSVKGKTNYKLVLQLPGTKRPMAILSEGEQRAIALASFLAEVKVGGGSGGIVFDDPVCSLDHRRRELGSV